MRNASFLPLLALLFAASIVSAALPSGSKIQQTYGTGTNQVSLLADTAQYNWGDGQDSNWATFLGNVVIRCNGNELHAEKVRYNSLTHAAEAEGRVTLLGSNGETWSGNALNVDMTNPKFPKVESSDMAAFYDPYRVEAEKGGIRNGAYYAENVTFTTCTNAPGHRHYEFFARDATIVPDDDITAHGVVPYLFGIPYFYWPCFWKDLHNHYGFRFEPGFCSRWGVYLLGIYKFRIWRFDDDNWGDSRTHFDLRSKRGFALGETINWYDTDIGDGWLSVYGLQDEYKKEKLLRDGVEDTERYRVRLNHDLAITDADRILVQGLYVSDSTFLRDFFEEEHEVMPQPENYVNYTHTEDDYDFGIEADFRINDFYTQVERLPEAWFNVEQCEVAETGLFYESETAAAFLQKRFSEKSYENADDLKYDAGRFDTDHALSYPLKVAGIFSVVPTLSWRGTYYSKTKESYEEESVNVVSLTNDFGQVFSYSETNTVTRTEEAGADFRNVVRFDLDFSFKAYGMWTDEEGTPWRHVIEPYAEYTYIPEPNVLPEDLFQFDSIDEIDFTHTVRLGIRNRWQCKDPTVGADGQIKRDKIREFAYINPYAKVRLEPEEDEETVESLHLDTVFRPVEWLRAKADITYGMDEGEITRITSLLQIHNDIVRATGEYIYRLDSNSLLMGEFAWKATSLWEFSLFGRYEFEDAQVEKVGAYAQMNFDCISLRLMAYVYPGYTRSDGVKEEDDYRVSFSLWEHHFAPSNVNKTHY